jgi:hypothetical protein
MNVLHPQTGQKVVSISDAEALLKSARSAYEAAAADAAEADRAKTQARGALNDAQIAFDNAVAAIRADAPRDTKWHCRDGEMVAA